jgi:hypothetical protein
MAASRSLTLFEFWSGSDEWGLERPPRPPPPPHGGEEEVEELEARVRPPGLADRLWSVSGRGSAGGRVGAATAAVSRLGGSRLAAGCMAAST